MYLAVQSWLETRAVDARVQEHLASGRRLAAAESYPPAIAEYQQALAIKPDDGELLRHLVAAQAELLQVHGLGDSNFALDLALRGDYRRFAPLTTEQLENVSALLGRLQSLDPSARDDVEVLLDEALIWKASGMQAARAIPPLQKAARLAPSNSRVLAELGLLETLTANDAKGIDLIRRAIELDPASPRYPFYLGRALAEAYRCPYGSEQPASESAEACAEAIRAYRRARRWRRFLVWPDSETIAKKCNGHISPLRATGEGHFFS